MLGSPRLWDELRYAGETCSQNRDTRLMRIHAIQCIPHKTRWCKKGSGKRPDGVQNHLARNFRAEEPNTKWVTDITFIETAEGWLYLCGVKDLCTGIIVAW